MSWGLVEGSTMRGRWYVVSAVCFLVMVLGSLATRAEVGGALGATMTYAMNSQRHSFSDISMTASRRVIQVQQIRC